jgi:O-antigen ligase
MKITTQNTAGFDRARILIAGLLLIVYGLGLDQFASALPGFEFMAPKYIWFFLFLIIFPILLFTSQIRIKIGSPILSWLLAYNLICLIGLTYAADFESAYAGFVNLCATNMIVLPAYLAADSRCKLPFWLCIAVYLMAVGSIVTDFFFPFQTFGINTQGIINRASGFYLNPNGAGIAICFLELLVILRSPPRFVPLIVIIGLLAIILTFSRGAFYLQITLLFGLLWAGVMRLRSAAILALFIVPFIGFSTLKIAEYLELSDGNVLNRLDFISGKGTLAEVADDDRFYLLTSSIQSYINQPFFGGGLGFHLYWDQIGDRLGSTHNMTLRYMLDFGFIGIFIWGGFCLAILKECQKSASLRLAAVISMLTFLVSFFSHNLTEEGRFLVPLYFSVMTGLKQNSEG